MARTEGQSTTAQNMSNGPARNSMDPNTVNTVKDALAVLNDAAEKGSTEIRDMIRRDYQELARTLSEIRAEVRPTITNAVKDLRDQGYNTANEYKEQAMTYAREQGSTLDRKVHEKPWNYLAYAAIGGFLLGLFKRR